MGLDFGRRSNEGWSLEQQKALSIIPHVTGSLSILGSAFIIYDVLSDRKKWSSSYHRLLFAMGIFDFMSSWGFMLSTTVMPSHTLNVYQPLGNRATCTTQGFFMNLNIASPLYNFTLSIYFLLSVTFQWSKDDIKKKVEPWLHGIPIVWALITTFIVLGQSGFNDSTLWCWVASYPKGCHKDSTCTRCPLCTEIYRWVFFFGPLWTAAFGTIVVMGMLVYGVHKTEKKAAKWRAFPATVPEQEMPARKAEMTKSSLNNNNTDFSNTDVSLPGESSGAHSITGSTNKEGTSNQSWPSRFLNVTQSRNQKRDREEEREARRKASKMTRVVTGQAFRYCFVFWATWLPGTINRILQLVIGHSYFWLMFLHVIFTPMQGFWNFMVYIYLRVKKHLAEKKKARLKAKKIETLKSTYGASYNPTIHVVSEDEGDNDDDFDEDDL